MWKKVLSKLDFRPNNTIGRGKKEEKRKGGGSLEREAPPSLYFSRRSKRWFLEDQEEKCFPAQRVSSRDRKQEVSKKIQEVGLLLL